MNLDAYTETWRTVAAKANEQIEVARSRLEEHEQSYGESEFLRGRISAFREILSMARPAVVASNPEKAVPVDFRNRDLSGI